MSLVVIDTSNQVYLNQVPSDVEFFDLSRKRVRYALIDVVRLIKATRPNIVFSTLGHLNLALAIIRFLLPSNIKFIARETSIVSKVHEKYKYTYLWKLVTFIFYRKVDIVVCQSKYMRNDLIQNYGVPYEKTVIIYNPVDIEGIRKKLRNIKKNNNENKYTYFVAAGRLADVKGFDNLIKAIDLIKYENIKLDILGEGPLFNKLTKLINEYKLSHIIRLVGYQSNPYEWFFNADAFVLSSYYEGFPNVILEALACGTPVISTPAIGGLSEILRDRKSNIIADEISAEALAEALKYWIKSPKTKISHNDILPFSCDKIMNRYQNLFMKY